MRSEDFKPGTRCVAYVDEQRVIGYLNGPPCGSDGSCLWFRVEPIRPRIHLLVNRYQCRLLKKKVKKEPLTRARFFEICGKIHKSHSGEELIMWSCILADELGLK